MTFCFDGHEDGEVSRPWGVCVNKNNEIVVADRRNNRIQVFFADGTFKFKFGSKGTGNGQFDLPAGVGVDPQNRIGKIIFTAFKITLITFLFFSCG